ncbi:LysR family transcriptional regulator [Azotobacter vinelandii]|uniref:LysR family transcriptional regulator n=1 Tax=Azotobacter vinelandii TaxID=354 RepID=UPI0009E75400|nr:LysR family transcriptional regulator [Azotobacter vinelandii]WKN19822.1 LysR family transcriptional regulator [Azotobacter vinelandii]
MDRLLCMEAFVRVAETGNFAKAARQLGVTRSVISHRIQQLEQFIQAPLFHRSSRHVRLSEVGETYYQDCVEMLAGFERLTENMRNLRAKPQGRLRIQVTSAFAIDYLGYLLAEFMQLYPGIELEVVVQDRIVDLIQEGFDVALQFFPSLVDTLVERQLFRVRRVFCASPGYLRNHAAPCHPSDLLRHTIGLYDGYPSRYQFVFRRGDERLEINLPGQVRSSSVHLLRDFALGGAGIVCLPSLVAGKELLAGRLVPVLGDYAVGTFAFRAVYPTTQRGSLKVRKLIEFLAERLAQMPHWEGDDSFAPLGEALSAGGVEPAWRPA